MGFGKSKEEDVVALIAAKKYARAIEVLKAQLQKRGANPSLRMQLADVLILADKKQEAVSLLIPLADQFARDGFAAKAVSVLKKIQKVDPGRRDVEERLARQIEERQREAVSLPLSRAGSAPGSEPSAGVADDGPSLEIGFEMAPMSAPPTTAELPPLELPKAVAEAPPDSTLPVTPQPPVIVAPEPLAIVAPEPLAIVAPPSTLPSLEIPTVEPLALEPADAESPTQPVQAKAAEESIEDYDLLYYAEDGDEDEEIDVPLEAELVEATAVEPMSAGQFADELMGLVDSVFQEFPGAAPASAQSAGVPASSSPDRSGSHIVVSPLFRDFSVDEMVAVIQGLKLLSFERGEAILKEGQPGGSLYMLTSGRVRAFKKDGAGKQSALGDLKEG
ncbi:MAG: cyclic nucleotide-binding domain-containing protein, partial [Vicinamibacterales bacterium]